MAKITRDISSPPKILHVFDGFRVGGTEMRTCSIMNNFSTRFRHIIVSNNGNLDASRHVGADIDVRYLHPKISSSFKPLTTLKICRELRNVHADVMIAYEWGAIDWVLANCIIHSCPTIMTVEGFEDSELFVQNKRRMLIRRLLYGSCDRVAVCSKALYDIAIDKWKLQPPRLLHIPNGVDCSRFKPWSEDRKQKGEVRLGIVASLIKLKNHRKLLEHLRDLPKDLEFSLKVAGDGPEMNGLKQFCNESGLSDKVRFLGHVTDTPSFLRELDVFCLSSITEQMPMVVLEAMATGLPIISTDAGDIKLMVANENKPFVVDKDNDASYVQALIELIKNEPLRRDIGASNRRKCLQNYDEKIIFPKYEELYLSCINNRR